MWACKKRKQAKNKYPGNAPAAKEEAREEPVLKICGRAKKESKRRTAIQAMHLQFFYFLYLSKSAPAFQWMYLRQMACLSMVVRNTRILRYARSIAIKKNQD